MLIKRWGQFGRNYYVEIEKVKRHMTRVLNLEEMIPEANALDLISLGQMALTPSPNEDS